MTAPLVPLESAEITPTCVENRGEDGAWEEAVARLREVYLAQRARKPDRALTLTISRGPAW